MNKKAITSQDGEASSVSKTCFVMMPISDNEGYPSGHFAEVYKELIEPAVTDAGYECTLATSTGAAHLIQLEVVTRVATADLCICDLSTNNPNVLFEYGIRQAFDKPTVLLKDDKTRRIFDLTGFRDIEYDHTLRIANILKTRSLVTKAIEDTVGGSSDESQIFSLVKLMKLAKAALPAGEVSADDARFALIEKKLDSISRAVLTVDRRDIATSGGRLLAIGKVKILFKDDLVEIMYPNGAKEMFSNFNDLDKSNFYRNLSLAHQDTFLKHVFEYSPMVAPF